VVGNAAALVTTDPPPDEPAAPAETPTQATSAPTSGEVLSEYAPEGVAKSAEQGTTQSSSNPASPEFEGPQGSSELLGQFE